MGAVPQQVCVVLNAAEREQLAAIVTDRNRPRKHVERAGIVLASADRHSGAAGGATHRRQSADGVAVATTLRERDRGFVARQDPQTRQGADRGGNHGAGGGIDVHRAAAPGDPLDRPGNGAWLAPHPRWTFHFTPTSASWLNAVENFLSKMTRQRIRRGVFHSIADLQTAINAYLAEHNDSPTPFVWTPSAETIMAKLERCPVPSV
jgi:hypothetical protein